MYMGRAYAGFESCLAIMELISLPGFLASIKDAFFGDSAGGLGGPIFLSFFASNGASASLSSSKVCGNYFGRGTTFFSKHLLIRLLTLPLFAVAAIPPMPPGPGALFGKPFGLLATINNGLFDESAPGTSSGSDSSFGALATANPSASMSYCCSSSIFCFLTVGSGFTKTLFTSDEIFVDGAPNPPGPGALLGGPFGLLVVINNGFFGESDGFSSGSDSTFFTSTGASAFSIASTIYVTYFGMTGFSRHLLIILLIPPFV